MAVVSTRFGKLEGLEEGDLHVFRGVPYARPPVGELRFRPPEEPESWSGTREALAFGPTSLQPAVPMSFMGSGPKSEDESCLWLNVWAPALDGAKRAVMVWIHGGAFVIGAGSDPLYSGAELARAGDVVVVTINYRLGVLGYLAHPDLRDPATGACGNWGLLDQIAAIRWVKEHAESFGGDPDRITIFGESAGSMSTGDLLATPLTDGLFARAIQQSGPPIARGLDESAEDAEQVAAALGVSGAAALRGVAAEALLDTQQKIAEQAGAGGLTMRFQPCIDGAVLPSHPRELIEQGAAGGVSVLAGSNRDELKLFSFADSGLAQLDDEGLVARVAARVDGEGPAAAIVATYRAAREARGEPATPSELWTAIESDRFFRVPTLRHLGRQASHGAAAYSYLFTWESPMMGGLFGAAHAVELPFVFGTLGHEAIGAFAGSGPEAERLSRQMVDSWTAFARTGDPSCDAVGEWPAYDVGRRASVVFGAETALEDAPREPERAAWDGVADPLLESLSM